MLPAEDISSDSWIAVLKAPQRRGCDYASAWSGFPESVRHQAQYGELLRGHESWNRLLLLACKRNGRLSYQTVNNLAHLNKVSVLHVHNLSENRLGWGGTELKPLTSLPDLCNLLIAFRQCCNEPTYS